jgi:hypothetical protein
MNARANTRRWASREHKKRGTFASKKNRMHQSWVSEQPLLYFYLSYLVNSCFKKTNSLPKSASTPMTMLLSNPIALFTGLALAVVSASACRDGYHKMCCGETPSKAIQGY